MAFTGVAAITVIVSALLLATGEPKLSLATSRTTPRRRQPPSRPVVHQRASAAAPVVWILLLLAIAALGFAAWLWLSWGRLRPPTAPA